MDLTQSIVPKSDQINADDLIATGSITVTVDKVTAGGAEQPVDIHLVEFPGRAYRPSKSMRRVLVAAWGKESAAYTGRRLTLYRNPNTKFGRDVVGGIEISHLSDIDQPLTLALTATRGKRAAFTVQPLTDTGPTAEDIAASTDVAALRGWWQASNGDARREIEARVAELTKAEAKETDTLLDPWDNGVPAAKPGGGTND